jgi:HSP20 family protein
MYFNAYDMHRNMDRFFDEVLNGSRAAAPVSHAWGASEVKETPEYFLLSLDLPGVPREQLKIESKEGELTIEASRRVEWLHAEAPKQDTLQYRRVFALPKSVDAERIEARLQDGVLQIALPKKEAVKPRQIKLSGEAADKGSFWSKLLPESRNT